MYSNIKSGNKTDITLDVHSPSHHPHSERSAISLLVRDQQ